MKKKVVIKSPNDPATDAEVKKQTSLNLPDMVVPREFHMSKHWRSVLDTNEKLENVIEDLDGKLSTVLAKQEYDYLKGYNLFVKRKEAELKELIEKLNLKNANSNNKDKKIHNLEVALFRLRQDQQKTDNERKKHQDENKRLKLEVETTKKDCAFLHR